VEIKGSIPSANLGVHPDTSLHYRFYRRSGKIPSTISHGELDTTIPLESIFHSKKSDHEALIGRLEPQSKRGTHSKIEQ
jgi:hypothetical protein